jgi:NTE family protein
MRIGLALSGGGYRAAAYHLGTLKRLYELNILDQVDVISTVSGGSITGAYYCLNKDNFSDFEQKLKKRLTEQSTILLLLSNLAFIRVIILFMVSIFTIVFVFWKINSLFGIIFFILFIYILLRYQFKILPVSKIIEKVYNKIFYENATLSTLPDRPILAIASTNLQTSRPFTFSKEKIGDSYYEYLHKPIKFKQHDFPIAKAVAASSSVPFAFTPIDIEQKYFQNPDDFYVVTPKLIDGGIYDNQGIQKLTQRGSSYECDIIITSDAGNKLPFEKAYNNTFILLLRTVDTFMARIKAFQMTQHLYNAKNLKKEIAYLSLSWDFENCIPGFINAIKNGNLSLEIIKAHEITNELLSDIDNNIDEIVKIIKKNVHFEKLQNQNIRIEDIELARKVTTNLINLSEKQVDCLMHHAAILTELQIRLYCPSLWKGSKIK